MRERERVRVCLSMNVPHKLIKIHNRKINMKGDDQGEGVGPLGSRLTGRKEVE